MKTKSAYLAIVDSTHTGVVARAQILGAVCALEASDLVEHLCVIQRISGEVIAESVSVCEIKAEKNNNFLRSRNPQSILVFRSYLVVSNDLLSSIGGLSASGALVEGHGWLEKELGAKEGFHQPL
jgi:hypothetical protein